MKRLPLLMVFLTISACGGSDNPLGSSSGVSFNGNQQAASISSENAEAIGAAAGESIQGASLTGSLPSPITVVNSTHTLMFLDDVNVSDDNATQDNVFFTTALLSSCISGTAESSQSSLDNGKVSQVIVYNKCRLSASNVIANGKLTALYNNINDLSAGFSLTYTNFTLSNSVTADLRLNIKVTCTSLTSCIYHSDFIGRDNGIHRVSAFNVTGSASSGFNGSATFYHDRYGKVSIASSGLTYGLCGSRPTGGVIAFSSSRSSGTINFDSDCTVSGTWSNSFGSGSF